MLPLASILFTVISRGYQSLRINTFTQDMSLTQPEAAFDQGGALHAILGTLILVAIASAISVPLGILTGLYLTEVKGRAENLIRFLVQAMSGVPSIVAGLFIYSVIIIGSGGHYSGFAGALALSILMLPTVARTAEEVLKLIPNDLREAGVALGALSVDHLESMDDKAINILASSNTIGTLLPTAAYFLRMQFQPARALIDAGCAIAIASDFNPGSCHCDNLIMIASLAAPLYKMNQVELWCAITLNAANALGLRSQGAIVEGLKPRFTFFQAPSLDHVTYSWGKNLAN
jgi:hypothetical protein